MSSPAPVPAPVKEVPRTLIAEFAERLGFDPVHVREMTITPQTIEVTAYRTQDGHPYIDGPGVAAVIVTIPIT